MTTNADYHADPAISASHLKAVLEPDELSKRYSTRLPQQPEAMTTTTKMRRFYFQIRSANVIECIWAHSLTDAKAKAALTWMPWWQELEWLNPENVTDIWSNA